MKYVCKAWVQLIIHIDAKTSTEDFDKIEHIFDFISVSQVGNEFLIRMNPRHSTNYSALRIYSNLIFSRLPLSNFYHCYLIKSLRSFYISKVVPTCEFGMCIFDKIYHMVLFPQKIL